MTIGGIQKLTLQDYPGYLSAIIFTQGCQLRCPYCHNSNIAFGTFSTNKTAKKLSEQDALDFLAKKSAVLDGVVISGGEPLLQQDLPHFLSCIKDLGYSIKLDTNGLLPNRLKEIKDKNLIDYVALDFKAPFDRWSLTTGIEAISYRAKQSWHNKWLETFTYLIETNFFVVDLAKPIVCSNGTAV